MDSLIIEGTDDSPSVNFNTLAHQFVISGESRPENAGKFYTPILDWICNYESVLNSRKNDNPALTFVFKLDYFNSTSAKYLMDIILLLKKQIEKGHKINVEWHYDKRDDDMLDAGKEFADTVDLEFNFISF